MLFYLIGVSSGSGYLVFMLILYHAAVTLLQSDRMIWPTLLPILILLSAFCNVTCAFYELQKECLFRNHVRPSDLL